MKKLRGPYSLLVLFLTMSTGCPDEGGGLSESSGGDDVDSGPAPDVPDGPCENVPAPSLPFPAGTSMGITQKPGCGGHQGSIQYGYDFNIAGSYETANDLVATASSAGTVVDVVDSVVGGCDGCSSAAYNGGWGNCVIVQIENSCIYERYCHLDVGPNSIFVAEGDYVCRGTPLGLIGSTGNSTGSHLHWQREDENHQSIPVDSFVEVDIPGGCEQCTINNNQSGCFASQNQEQCDPVPSSPCAGLQDGDYCGSNNQLQGYEGSPSDLVTCDGNQVASVMACEYGCSEQPPGTDDECNVPGADCGNGAIDLDEQCDGANLGGATCQSEGYDAGTLMCSGCVLDASQCCTDACNPGATMCTSGAVSMCGNTPMGCGAWGTPTVCEFGCDGTGCSGEPACTNEHTILNAEYPAYTANASGCALDNGVKLKVSAQNLGSTIRFHVRKTDDTTWGAAATMTLYVGTGPTCGDPPNVEKVQVPVVVGQVTQIIDLGVDPYDAAWPEGETKQFWVGKSESGFPATRSTGAISIRRDCL